MMRSLPFLYPYFETKYKNRDVLMDTYASPSPSVPVPHPHRWFHPPVVRRFAEVIILMLLRVVVIILVVPMEM